MTCDAKQNGQVVSYGILANSIQIPPVYQRIASQWYGGMDDMLYAVSSTGNLTCGMIAPRGCENDVRKHYLQIWRELAADIHTALKAAVSQGCSDDADTLEAFEAFADRQVMRLEESYGLVDWDCWEN
jgi:hypothetical protein